MSIVNCDVLIEGVRRDAVFEWMSDPVNHSRFVVGSFDQVDQIGTGEFKLTFSAPPKTRQMGYHFDRPDDSHGGRRVLVQTTGKRTKGTLNYSFRTMKPSRNTLITLTMDYNPGSVIGGLLDRAGMAEALEKNLKKLFDEAERVGAGLLFDEADSVFGKRTSGDSSTDRYANMETNYLLQRVETTDCLVIMTTNYPDNMDPAFMRRIQFNVKFPFPDKDDRERLWRSQIPKEAKLAEDVNFKFLASEYELSGGRIRNAVLTAAFKAVESGQAITTAMFEEGARKEYRAMGRIVREQVETPAR